MRSFLLHKLVRDKVFTSMQDLGQQITRRTLEGEEYQQQLIRKLLEETQEFANGSTQEPKELADLLEVIEALVQEQGMSFEELRELQLKIREKRGGFAKRIYVERLDLEDDDPWVKYYANEPDRFKEITKK